MCMSDQTLPTGRARVSKGSGSRDYNFLRYCLFDCIDIISFSNKPPFQIQTYPQSLIKIPGKEENRLTLTECNRPSLFVCTSITEAIVLSAPGTKS